jgi:hypothetical protein
MSLIDETRYLERRQFFKGERLYDADLNDQEEFHRQMRWLHNRSLHQPGIGNGYAIAGSKGDREVVVGPGYAIDAFGREIVLVQGTTLAVPPVAGEPGTGKPVYFYLTASYPDDATLSEAEVRQGICGNRGAVRLAERPDLCWVRLSVSSDKKAYIAVDTGLQDKISANVMIVLALVEVLQCQLNAPLLENALAPQRSARLQRLPYTASGVEPSPPWVSAYVPGLDFTTVPDAAKFPLTVPAPFRLTAIVNTTGAMFGAIPRYLPRISGVRVLTLPGPATVFLEPVIDLKLDPSFTNHLRFQVEVSVLIWIKTQSDWNVVKNNVPTLAPVESELEKQLKQAWSIVWLGVEG